VTETDETRPITWGRRLADAVVWMIDDIRDARLDGDLAFALLMAFCGALMILGCIAITIGIIGGLVALVLNGQWVVVGAIAAVGAVARLIWWLAEP
jgi:hypothetical protein